MTRIQFALNDISWMFPSNPQNIPTCWSIVVMINGDNWPMALSTSLDQSHRLSCWQDRRRTKRVAAASGKRLFLTLSLPGSTCLPPSFNAGLWSSVTCLERSSLTSQVWLYFLSSHLNPALFFLKALKKYVSMLLVSTKIQVWWVLHWYILSTWNSV